MLHNQFVHHTCCRVLSPLEKVVAGLKGRYTNPALKVVDLGEKGRGVVCEDHIQEGDFVLEYKTHEVYPRKDMESREEEYRLNGEGCYILEAQTPVGWLCFDATRKVGSLGRLINHSSTPNLRPFRPLQIERKWRVGFLATRTIRAGEELVYDYGCEPSGLPWLYRRQKVCLLRILGCNMRILHHLLSPQTHPNARVILKLKKTLQRWHKLAIPFHTCQLFTHPLQAPESLDNVSVSSGHFLSNLHGFTLATHRFLLMSLKWRLNLDLAVMVCKKNLP